ncbi:hypothetical protein [Mycobacterium aquaticum]|nr:hypothetical protein [Mycobacterium aquaticum]
MSLSSEPGHPTPDAGTAPVSTASKADRSSRKWIRRRIAQLDPYVDYREIWALSYIYNVTDFDLHWAYTVDNCHLGLTTWGADASYRDGTGAMMVRGEQRMANTNDHMLLWSEHGPDSPITKQAIDIVNKQHAQWAKYYNGAFSHSEDYIYLFAAAATAEHDYKRSLGLPGWSEKQKIASHLFWSELAKLFRVESGEVLTDVEPMPESFEACSEYARAYTERPWPDNTAIGLPFSERLIEQFLAVWFPYRVMRPFGRALITTFFAPTLFRIYQLEEPNWVLRTLARGFAAAKYIYRDYIRADQKEPITERHRQKAAAGTYKASYIDSLIHRVGRKQNPTASGCPFHGPVPVQRDLASS